MILFLDTCDPNEIDKYWKLGIFKGITTTPTFFFRSKTNNYDKAIKHLVSRYNCELHLETIGNNKDEIIGKIAKNHLLGENIVSKIPINYNALEVLNSLRGKKYKINVHLIFSLSQALMAAEAGAMYVCPLVGRINDIGGNAKSILEKIVNAFDKYNLKTKIMASSIRTIGDIEDSLELGVDCLTIPTSLIEKMICHPLTEKGKNRFTYELKLMSQVGTYMRKDSELPIMNQNGNIFSAISIMTEKKLGIAIIVDDNKQLVGIITDGDIRRALDKKGIEVPLDTLIIKNPITSGLETTVQDSIEIMTQNKITALIIVENKIPIGLINLHDVLDQ